MTESAVVDLSDMLVGDVTVGTRELSSVEVSGAIEVAVLLVQNSVDSVAVPESSMLDVAVLLSVVDI